jgi:uncharacterized membrane protein YkoI
MKGSGKIIGATVLATVLSFGTAAENTQNPKPGPTFGRKVENTFRNWKLEELPAKVQTTVREQGFGHKIKDIDREDRTGRTVWEVRFDGGPNGAARKVHIDNDGKLVDGDGKPIVSGRPATVQTNSASSTKAPLPPPPGNSKGQPEKAKRKWADVPDAVKKASAKYGTEQYIRDIDVEERDGMTVWELEFSREGQNIELHFTEDGRVLEHIDSGNKTAPQQP